MSNDTNNIIDCLIIGAGPAGLGASLYAGRSGLNIRIIEKLSPGGQAIVTDWIDNYLGFKDGISGFELIENMKAHALRFAPSVENGEVIAIRKEEGIFSVELSDRTFIATRTIIIATGARPRKLNVPGEEELTGKGVSYCATCDGPFFRDQTIAVVGGGDSACQEALFLTNFAKKIYLIHRRDELRAVKTLQDKVLNNEKIEMIWNATVEEIKGDAEVTGCILKDTKTGELRELKVGGVFIFIGIIPNTEFIRRLIKTDDLGFIITDDWMETSLEGLFAAGDCRAKNLRQVITAVSDGAIAAYGAKHRLI